MFFRKRRPERQLESEIRFHMDSLARDYIAEGMDQSDARRRARPETRSGVRRLFSTPLRLAAMRRHECRRGTHQCDTHQCVRHAGRRPDVKLFWRGP
jgi:hypothetical protein